MLNSDISEAEQRECEDEAEWDNEENFICALKK